MAASVVRAPGDKNLMITKVKVRKGQRILKGALFCLFKTDNDDVQKLKATSVGTVTEVFVKDGDKLKPGEPVLEVEPCSHPTVMKDMCADCGADLRRANSSAGDRKEGVSASVAMVHNIPELIVSEQQALELGKADEERLLKTRKLVLLVDLDQTLIHTTNDNIPANLKDVHHFQLWHGKHLLWYHTRLRPGTLEFLENISKLYELHICTFGVRVYAHTIANLIDPEGKFFSHRILSRDECFNATSKVPNMKALFPCGDSMVCIIDDREDVWNFVPNLVHVKPYRFFQGTADINAPPGLTKTENDDKPVIHRVRRVSQSEVEAEIKSGHHGHLKHPDDNVTTNINGHDTQCEQGADNHEEQTAKTDVSDKEDEKQKSENKPDEDMEVSMDTDEGGISCDDKSKESDTEALQKSDVSLVDSNTATTNVTDKVTDEVAGDKTVTTKEKSESDENTDHSEEKSGKNTNQSEEKSGENTNQSEEKSGKNTNQSEEKSGKNTNQSEEKSGENTNQSEEKSGKNTNQSEEKSGKNTNQSEEKSGENINQSEEKSGENTNQSEEKSGENINQSEEKSGENINQSEEKSGENTNQSEEKSGENTNQSEEKSGENTNQSEEKSDTTSNGQSGGEVKTAEAGSGDGVKKREGNGKEGGEEGEWLEWDDDDDYLFYLEETLTNIHKVFYDMHDQLKSSKPESTEEKPNLKNIVSYIRKKVFKDCNLVFSGIIPTNMPVEKNRAYQVAVAFGANIQNDFVCKEKGRKNATTHVIANKFGTSKVNAAQKEGNVPIVTVDWLWCCSERWEKVETALFLLKEDKSKEGKVSSKMEIGDVDVSADQKQGEGQSKRKFEDIKDSTERPESSKRKRVEEVPGTSSQNSSKSKAPNSSSSSKDTFSLSYNPLFAFSDDDIACMDKEVEDILDDDEEGSDEDEDARNSRIRQEVLHSSDQNDQSSSDESMSADMPRGWGLKRKQSPRQSLDLEEKSISGGLGQGSGYESETELEKFVEAFVPDSDSSEEDQESIGSVDEELADAVEKEFLSM